MDFSLFLTIVAAAICFVFLRKLRFDQENQKTEPSSLSPPSPPSSLLSLPSPPSSLSHPSSSLSPPSSLSHPSSSSHNWIHDVFPSFRGEDVRRDFLSHIQKEFGRKGITPFIDNEIKRGESIAPELIRAIRGSKIAIILLSKNYASSKWCLDELAEIMKCREELGQTVIVIFYKVDPSHVKKLAGDFGKVFKKTCEGKSKEDIERWRQALVKVATIAGYDSSNWDNEAAMIEKIANEVSNNLISYVPSSDFEGLIGMRAHMENMDPILRLDSNEVRMIGIWGPSGIGKSTIARVLLSKHSHQFQVSVFMENIKRRYPRPCYDEYSAKLQLQKEFLSQIINNEDIKIRHLGVAQDRLKDKRVFVVLDDVDQSVQLDAVAKETGWFGSGSRIIITTQDKNLLNAHGISHIYDVGFPAYDEALEIFSMYAFGQKSPYDGFEKLAWEVTILAGRLPLGLRVMGSHLKRRTKQEWKRELPRLRTCLDGEIESILEFSYNALRVEDKELFLYIACFFNYKPIEKVEELLANSFSSVRQGLHVLAEKSLISVSSLGYIEMHGLLERFGREIVRRQSINDPGQRQFLVDARDICKVLNNDTISRGSVIGAIINFFEIKEELNNCDNALESMPCLQFLRLDDLPFGNSYLPRSLNKLPRKVRLLDWQYFPMTCLPSNFNPEFLVELNMPSSKLERLWEGIKTIRNLKWMDLSRSDSLRELPDLSTATNLRELDLSRCSSLVELPYSIGNAINLRKLLLSKCSSLIELPSSIGSAITLEKLNLHGCSRLVELPFSIGNATNLKELNLSDCSSLVKLPSSIGNVTSLEDLDLSGCSSLMELLSFIGNTIKLERLNLSGWSSLVKLPSSIGNVTSLADLNLSGCSSLVELPSSMVNATNLEVLNLSSCLSLVDLHSSIGNATNIQKLNLSGCSRLVELPSSICNATNLEVLNLNGCSSLLELSSSIWNAINNKQLNLSGCSSIVELPSFIRNATIIQELNLSGCSNLVELPTSIENATNLEVLNLSGCLSLMKLPSTIGNAIMLKRLNLSGCLSLVELPSSIGNITSLSNLDLSGCSNIVELPSSIGNIKVQLLNLSGCSSLVELPSFVGNVTSLGMLDLSGCSSLVELPSSIGNTNNFKELNLSGCSSLVELPSSIGNITGLWNLDLSGCWSLVKLPSSIGNLKLRRLHLQGCSKLEAIPINMESLSELNITDCLWLKKFPEISTNIELPSWSRFELHISENLGEFSHAFKYITEMHMSDKRIKEIAPWVKELSRLQKLVIKGCTKLVSLPQLPGSLEILDAENCESLERLHCSFHNTRFVDLNFVNCFRLSQEARDLIIKTSVTCRFTLLPGEKVPPHFTYRAIGSSLSMKLNGAKTDFPSFSSFRACVLLVNKGDMEVGGWNMVKVSHRIRKKQNGVNVMCRSENIDLSTRLKKHLLIFQCEEWKLPYSSSELVLEFIAYYKEIEIQECGIRILTKAF